MCGQQRALCASARGGNHLGVISEPAQSITRSNTISALRHTESRSPPVSTASSPSCWLQQRRNRETCGGGSLEQINYCRQKRKLRVCNGLTAEGLASPLARVTRLCEVAPPSQRPQGENHRLSPPPDAHPRPVALTTSCRSPPRGSVISHIQETTGGTRVIYRNHEGPHART